MGEIRFDDRLFASIDDEICSCDGCGKRRVCMNIDVGVEEYPYPGESHTTFFSVCADCLQTVVDQLREMEAAGKE